MAGPHAHLVGVGPGSFTVILVGIAAAHGLDAGRRAFGLSSLVLIAASVRPPDLAVAGRGGHGELSSSSSMPPLDPPRAVTLRRRGAAVISAICVGSGAASSSKRAPVAKRAMPGRARHALQLPKAPHPTPRPPMRGPPSPRREAGRMISVPNAAPAGPGNSTDRPRPGDQKAGFAALRLSLDSLAMRRYSTDDRRSELARDHPTPAAGFSLFRTVAGEAELLLLAVAPERQGRGIGRQLLDQFIARARASGATRVHLEVRDGNSAVAMYRGAGFAPAGRRQKYYRGNDGSQYDAITLAYEL